MCTAEDVIKHCNLKYNNFQHDDFINFINKNKLFMIILFNQKKIVTRRNKTVAILYI